MCASHIKQFYFSSSDNNNMVDVLLLPCVMRLLCEKVMYQPHSFHDLIELG